MRVSPQPTPTVGADGQRRILRHFDREVPSATQAVIHAFRDGLAPEMAVRVGARLPFELREIFFRNWDPPRGDSNGSLCMKTPRRGVVAEDDEAERLAERLQNLLRAVFGSENSG